jgi:hypothetical protein
VVRAAVVGAGVFAPAFLAAVLAAIGTSSLRFNADLNAEPVANRTPFDAGIATAAPVRGFLPSRGARRTGVNVPNPTMVTFRPARTSATMVPVTASRTSSTARAPNPVDSLAARTSCDVFTITSLAVRDRAYPNCFYPRGQGFPQVGGIALSCGSAAV